MEGEIILKGGGVIGFGALFLWLGFTGWKARREERINLIEKAILEVAGEDEPLPLSRLDRAMAYIQPILMLIFGPLMILTGIAILGLLGD
ncbi:hypothetical protein [Qipengyuania nanhaisediminis]|uniref:hypothetical protein n=1 Tax=Qipengyuania nanhaisediminis TaxID=604088 RepID=UPI0038B30BB7